MTKAGNGPSYYQVYTGAAPRTAGGLTKNDILRIPNGKSPITGKTTYKYVSKARHNHGVKMMKKPNVKAAFNARKFKKSK